MELWEDRRNQRGDVLLRDIAVDTAPPTLSRPASQHPFFTAFDPAIGFELWKSNGTAAGTVLVKDICPARASQAELDDEAGGVLFSSPIVPTLVSSCEKSDGTEAGTLLVKDVLPGRAPVPEA